MARRRLAAFLVALGSAAGAAALWRRRSAKGKEHVDVYFADGSMVTFGEESDEAARLLPVARRVLSTTR
ncbi:MAG TPA: hypothetical protein VNO56_08720 [Gaiellaceae bacterium]|nr:hypothetical protein [Gaiellaceae bacterium]